MNYIKYFIPVLLPFFLFFSFINIAFANSYEYFDPVDVGSEPQRQSPSQVKNEEDKDSTVYSNDIDQTPITCTYQNSVTESKDPPWIEALKSFFLRVDSLTEYKLNNTYTNDVYRNSQLQYAKDPAINLDATDKDQGDAFKDYDQNGRNTSIRTQPYQYQLVNKGQFIEEAVISLTKTKDVIALDEPIAWNCNQKCQDLLDKDGNQPQGCIPITISEIGYYFYQNSQSTSYQIQNNQAVNIPFSDEVIKVFSNYKKYRSKFTSLIPDSQCYQKLYQEMPLVPRGTVNTKYIFHNIQDGADAPTPAYRAVPLAASLGSTQTSTTINLILPQKQQTEPDKTLICQQVKSSSPIQDRPSPLNIVAFIIKFIKNIYAPETINHPITTDVIIPNSLATNLDRDTKMMTNLIPQKNQEVENFENIGVSSKDANSNANIPDPGNQNSQEREYFAKIIIPKDWQSLSSGNSPESTGSGQPPSGSTLNPNVHQWCKFINAYSKTNGLSADIVAALINLESQGNPKAYSNQGAVGLMQVMASDGISAQLYPGVFDDRPPMAKLFQPEFNVQYGTSLLKSLVNYYGNIKDALYHYGPMGVGYAGYADLILNSAKKNPNYCQ